jgi:hydrogenase-4 component F
VIAALLLLPAAGGLLAFALRAAAWIARPAPILGGWLALGPLELPFLTVTSILSLAAAVYAAPYLARESRHPGGGEGEPAVRAPEALFTGCLLLFLATMTLVIAAQHFGLIWVAVEATTLASAPLIHFHRNHRSLEAAWKYLVICSVGIALALLGNFFLVVAAPAGQGGLTVPGLVRRAGSLDPAWLKAAFLLFLVGYGTKMGLAPLHTWLPDAHSEAPSLVSALLSGALLNCALLALLRIHAVCEAAGLGRFSGDLLILFGLLSMGLAAAFIIGQSDYKRLLAYSSVEHIGIITLGIGLGGGGGFAAILHLLNHSLTKGMLFLLAGNLLTVYRDKQISAVHGAIRVLPISGALWLAGLLALTGTPPFGLFLSEFLILKAAIDAGRWVVVASYLALLTIIFVGLAAVFLRMAYGPAPSHLRAPVREPVASWLPPALLAAGTLLLGVWLPGPLARAIEAALPLGGR